MRWPIGKKLSAEEFDRLESLFLFYNMVAKNPDVNGMPILNEIATILGIDPIQLVPTKATEVQK